jgi:hypothetical protein
MNSSSIAAARRKNGGNKCFEKVVEKWQSGLRFVAS